MNLHPSPQPLLLEQRAVPRANRWVGGLFLLLLALFWLWVAWGVPYVLTLPRGSYAVSRLLLPAVLSVLGGSHILGYLLRNPSQVTPGGFRFGVHFGRLLRPRTIAWQEVGHLYFQWQYGTLILLPYPREGRPKHAACFDGEDTEALAYVATLAGARGITLSEVPRRSGHLDVKPWRWHPPAPPKARA
jgi:hypothetical protein